MAGTSISVIDEATGEITRLVQRIESPAETLAAMAGYMLSSTQRRFEREEGPDGKKWKALSPRTANRRIGRRGRRGTANILRVTTQLYRSLSAYSDDKTAEVGTNMVQAAAHQFGATIEQYARSQRATFAKVRGTNRQRFAKTGVRGGEVRNITIGEHTVTIPARPFLGFSPADIAELLTIAAEGLAGEVAR